MSNIPRRPIVPVQQAYTMPVTGSPVSLGIQPHELGLRVQFEPKEKSAANVDIVAVHGLGARPLDAWVHPQTRANWLCDEAMLPQAVSKARIMTFNYDSSLFTVSSVMQSIDTITESFLSQLHQARAESPKRPLLFIGHCFGGLIIQRAYIATTTVSAQWENVANMAGAVFLGTPHFGASDSFFGPKPAGQFYDAIMQLNVQTYNSSLHRMADGNNDINAVVDHFLQILKTSKTPPELFSFYEQRSTRAAGMDLTVNENCGSVFGGRAGLPLDHNSINKFAGPMDPNYQNVSRVLADMSKKVEKKTVVAKKEPSSSSAEKRLVFDKRPNFAPREDILERIETEFTESVSVVLYGKSGYGKTQVAIQYMHKFHEKSPKAGVFWVFANTALDFEHSYKRIAKSLKISKETIKTDGLLASVHSHLNQDSSGSWLMIVDGANDEEALLATDAKVAGKPLLGYIPSAALHGKVLVTTRSKKLVKSVLRDKADNMIRVDTLGRKDASVVLLGKQTKDEKKKELVKATWKRMEGSAGLLAMVATYQKKLAKDSQGKLSPPVEGTPPDKEQWLMLHELVKLQDPGLLPSFLLVASLNVQFIPRVFFDQKNLDPEISMLTEYGVIEPALSGIAYSVPGLIQSCARSWLVQDQATKKDVEGRLIDTLSLRLTKDTVEELLPIALLTENLDIPLQDKTALERTRKLVGIFSLMAEYYAKSAQYAQAESFFKRCITLREQDPDKGHQNFRALLGETQMALQKVTSSLTRRQSTLSRKQSTRVPKQPLGAKGEKPDSKGKATDSADKIATKKVDSAKKLAEGCKKLQELEAQDPRWEHHSTVQAASYLAKLYVTYETGEKKEAQAGAQSGKGDSEAVALYRRIVHWCESSKTAPKDFKARSQYSLAIALDSQSRFTEAMELYIAARRFFQGLQKPGEWDRDAEVMELKILNNLACNYCAQGNLGAGEETFKLTLSRQTEIIGPNHPDTLVTRQNMALMMQQQQGRLEMATEELHRVLEAQTSIQGGEHQATLRASCSVALNQRLTGKLADSEALYNSTLKAQTKVLGEHHHDTSLTKVMLTELRKQVELK